MSHLSARKGFAVVLYPYGKPAARRGPGAPDMTVDRAVDGYLAATAARHKRSTHAAYERVAERHIRPALGPYSVSGLTPERPADFLAEKSAGTDGEPALAPSTVCGIITVLRAVLRYAEGRGCAVNAWAGLERPRPVTRPAEVLTWSEQRELAAFLVREEDPIRLGVLLCLYTGLRLGEVCALKWGDLSADGSVLSVRRTVQRIRAQGPGEQVKKTSVVFDRPKSQNALRAIPLPTFLRPRLDRLRGGSGCFLLTGTDKPLEPRVMQNHFKALLRQAGVREVNFHCLRHTFATSCVELGFDPKTVSMILGHADVSVTLNTYVHPSFSKLRSCMEGLGPGLSAVPFPGDDIGSQIL